MPAFLLSCWWSQYLNAQENQPPSFVNPWSSESSRSPPLLLRWARWIATWGTDSLIRDSWSFLYPGGGYSWNAALDRTYFGSGSSGRCYATSGFCFQRGWLLPSTWSITSCWWPPRGKGFDFFSARWFETSEYSLLTYWCSSALGVTISPAASDARNAPLAMSHGTSTYGFVNVLLVYLWVWNRCWYAICYLSAFLMIICHDSDCSVHRSIMTGAYQMLIKSLIRSYYH